MSVAAEGAGEGVVHGIFPLRRGTDGGLKEDFLRLFKINFLKYLRRLLTFGAIYVIIYRESTKGVSCDGFNEKSPESG